MKTFTTSQAHVAVPSSGGSWRATLGRFVLFLLVLAGRAHAQLPCVAVAGVPRTVCSGQITNLGIGPTPGFTYRWSPTVGLNNPNIANPTARVYNRSAGPIVRTYTLTVTGITPACTATSTVAITVNPGPIANPGPDLTVCDGQTFTVGTPGIPGYTYQWPVGSAQAGLAINNPNLAMPTYTATNPSQASFFRNVLLRVTAPNGCDTLVTLVITVEPAIRANAGPDVAFCDGAPATIGTPDNPSLTYSWSPATGLSNPTIAQPTVTLPNPGSTPLVTTYTLTVTNAAGCTATDQVQATVYPPAVANTGPALAVCAGQTATLAAGIAPVPGTTYSWSPATGLSNPNILNPTLTLPTAGTYTYTLTASVATASTACVSTASVAVTVAPRPVALAAPTPGAAVSFCSGETRQLGGGAAVPGVTYRWRPATGLNTPTAATTAITLTNSTTAPLTTMYTLVATAAAGCADSSSVTVTVNPATVVDAGPDVALCNGLAATLGTPARPGYTYSWTPATGLSSATAARPLVTATNTTSAPITIKYYLTATLGNGSCPSRDSVTVTFNPTPVALAAPMPGASVNLCSGETRQLGGGAAVPGVTYRWRPATGLNTPTAATTSITLTNNTAAPLTTVYTLVATAATGCVDSSSVSVTVNSIIVVDAGSDVALCNGLAATLGTPARPGYTYSWSPATGLSSATAARPLVTATNTTSAPITIKYYLTATLNTTGGSGCPARDSVTVTLNPAPVATITGPAVVCSFNQLQQYAVQAPMAGANYQWSVTGGSITAGQGTAQVTVQFAPGAAGYAVSVTPNSALGCASLPTSRSITIGQSSVALLVASVGANNQTINIGLRAAGGGQVRVLRRVAGQGSYAPVGTVPATATSFTDTGVDATANTYEYRLELTDGCANVVTSTLAQAIRLEATNASTPGTGGRDQGRTTLRWNAYLGFPVSAYQVYRSLDGGPLELVTTVAGNVLQATSPNTSAGGTTGAGFRQQFRVVAVGDLGGAPVLANSNTTSVDFANPLRTYNIITPNGDGRNDQLVMDNIGLYPGHALHIYNRWGREVFATTNYQNNWGAAPEVASGVHYYLLTLPDGRTVKGWVEVVK